MVVSWIGDSLEVSGSDTILNFNTAFVFNEYNFAQSLLMNNVLNLYKKKSVILVSYRCMYNEWK